MKRNKEFADNVILLYKNGITQCDIAVELGVSKHVVKRLIAKNLSKEQINEIVKNRRVAANCIFNGREFGRLTVKGHISKQGVGICFECECRCGKVVTVPKYWVLSGNTQSCGCLFDERKTSFGEISGKYWGHIQKTAYERGISFEIDICDAWDLFLKQNRKCAITGVELCFVKSYNTNYKNQTASLDRIDNAKGYSIENVQWVHKKANTFRASLSLDQIFSFAKKISNFRAVKAIEQADNRWETKYLLLAEFIASWSKDESTKVGAVIFDKNFRIVSLGYNGFAQKVSDKKEWLTNRDIKYKAIIHAEMNAMLFAERNLEDCSIVTWPFMPCSVCAAMLIQKGIKKVISIKNDNPRWQESFNLSKQMFREAGVELKLYEQAILPDDIWI